MLSFQIIKSITNNPLSGDELLRILNKISAENKAQNITGMLIYSEDIFKGMCQGRFIHVLEGEVNVLNRGVRRSMSEQYHKDVELVMKGVVLNRDFPDWSMGFDSGKLDERIDLNCYFDYSNSLTDIESMNESATIGIMKTFYDEQKKRELTLSSSY